MEGQTELKNQTDDEICTKLCPLFPKNMEWHSLFEGRYLGWEVEWWGHLNPGGLCITKASLWSTSDFYSNGVIRSKGICWLSSVNFYSWKETRFQRDHLKLAEQIYGPWLRSLWSTLVPLRKFLSFEVTVPHRRMLGLLSWMQLKANRLLKSYVENICENTRSSGNYLF